jgi:uncharacterized protein
MFYFARLSPTLHGGRRVTTKQDVPAIAGWFNDDRESPRLIGQRCRGCGTYFFPRVASVCKNPVCGSTDLEEVTLSNTGTLWSYTNAGYKPPPPFVAEEPYKPFTIAAVELDVEKMVVLGMVAPAFSCSDLKVGMKMELVFDVLFEDDESRKIIWKWQPARASGGKS